MSHFSPVYLSVSGKLFLSRRKRAMGSPNNEFIFTSKLPPIQIPDHLSLHSYCFSNAHLHASNPCIIDAASAHVHTYADVQILARRTAAGLRRLGVKRGDVVMLLLPNSPEFVFSFLAASYLGATATTANPAFTPAEVQKQASSAGASLAITESGSVEKLRSLDIRVVCVDEPVPEGCIRFSELLASTDDEELPDGAGVEADDVLALPYSSGTTGMPKGVMLTHRNLVTSLAQQVDGENPNLYFRNEDVILCVLPLFHIYSLNSVLLCGLRAGAAVVIVRRFSVAAMMEVVQRHRVTVLPVVPPMVVDIVKSPAAAAEYELSSVRFIISGAAPMGRELEDSLRAKIPSAKLGQGYGMTEVGVLAMCLAFAKEPFPIKYGACGTVVRNTELKIVDPDTRVSLPRNKPGEICIRGAQIMKGYLNDTKATEETIDNEGWLNTGDIGYVDDDDEIFIVDRLKEIIKYNGYQVAPAELEKLLIAHPNIIDAAVLPKTVERSGEVPVAFVKRSDGSEITEDEIKQYISKQVVFYKRIHMVIFTDSIPKSPSGKILRKELRGRLAAGPPNQSSPPLM